jgi:hypothetical protein
MYATCLGPLENIITLIIFNQIGIFFNWQSEITQYAI